VGRLSDQPPPTRVVEEPKRSIVPFLALAVVAAVVLYTVEQDRIQDLFAGGTLKRGPSNQAPLTRPQQPDLRTLFSADDYPAEAQRNDEEGTVRAALTVDAAGHVTNCTVIQSSNHFSLDQATCNILRRRARFTPARDASGTRVASRVLSPPITWRLEG
jgi:protein TonB